MMKKLALALSLVLAVGVVGCKKEEKAAAPASNKKPEEMKKPEEVKAPEEVKKPEEAKPGNPGMAAAGDLQKNALSSVSGDMDGVAKFSLGDTKGAGCDEYAKAVTPFFSELQKEYAQLQADADTKGAEAFDRFGQFLKKGAGELKNIKAEGALAAAHADLVGGIDAMGQGFIDLAGAVRAQDNAAGQKAADSLQGSTKQVAGAFDKLKAACSG